MTRLLLLVLYAAGGDVTRSSSSSSSSRTHSCGYNDQRAVVLAANEL